jgi:aspartyl-tRNA synthetase
MRTYIKELSQKAGEEVLICGSVDVRRDHGKLIFIDLRDNTGKVQVVFLPNHTEVKVIAETLRPEWVIQLKGKVNARPEKMINAKEQNGTVELEATEIIVLNEAKELPFALGAEINVDTHLDHLPFTLRTEKSRANRHHCRLQPPVRYQPQHQRVRPLLSECAAAD